MMANKEILDILEHLSDQRNRIVVSMLQIEYFKQVIKWNEK